MGSQLIFAIGAFVGLCFIAEWACQRLDEKRYDKRNRTS